MGNRLLLIQSHNWVTFLLAKLCLRRDDRYISYLLYSYLRSVDDFVDEKDGSNDLRKKFVLEQQKTVNNLYNNDRKSNTLIGRIIDYDRSNDCRLKPCILKMLEIFEFDVSRRNKFVSSEKLENYSVNLGSAYTQVLLNFVEPGYKYQHADSLLAHACHLAHMLRDFKEDIDLGYINLSKEEIKRYGIELNRISDPNLKIWLKDKIKLIKEHFTKGKTALDKNPILRIKLMGYLYCFRYETVIQQIEEGGYRLKDEYPMRFRDIMFLIFILISIAFRHLLEKIRL